MIPGLRRVAKAPGAHTLTHLSATAWGRLVGRYSQFVLRSDSFRTIFDAPVPSEPCVWVAWHEANMVSLMLNRAVIRRPVAALVPGGPRGTAMKAWLQDLGVNPIPLPDENSPRQALRCLAEALGDGCDVAIALDGPRGPRRRARPGALWLAAATGAPIAPIGIEVGRAIALPRWDRLLLPLPGASVYAVFGQSLIPRPGKQSCQLSRLACSLDALAARAVEARHNHPDL